MKAVITRAIAVTALAWTCGVGAQAWPGKPLSVIVGTPPGGSTDVYARTVAEHMTRTLGQPVVVENKPGANGNISAEYVLRAPADGYMVWMGTQSMNEINPSAFDNLRWSPDDFVGLIKGVEAPLILVTHPSTGAKTLAQLASWAKANPDKASYASFSPGTPSHFLGYQLAERLGVPMTHVPYKGSAPQLKDMVAGHILFGFTQIQAALPFIKEGKLNAVLTTGAARWRQLPDVPTLAELGHPDLSATIWFGLLIRKGTPPEIQKRLMEATVTAHRDLAVRSRLEGMGFDVPAQTDPEFTQSMRASRERWAKVVRATGFKASK